MGVSVAERGLSSRKGIFAHVPGCGIIQRMNEQETTQQAPRTKVLKNGAVYDLDKGRIVAMDPSKNPHTITAQKSNEFRQQRKEKQAALLRQAIVSETGDLLQVPTRGAAAAVAAAGGILWREIVLSPDAYPRDRMEAWEKLGRHAGILADPREPAQDTPLQQAAQFTSALADLVRTLRATIQPGDAHLHATDTGVIDAEE
jgi:hypothetical protein